jgi:4-hydroxybenzoate polyprenyltransferase
MSDIYAYGEIVLMLIAIFLLIVTVSFLAFLVFVIDRIKDLDKDRHNIISGDKDIFIGNKTS